MVGLDCEMCPDREKYFNFFTAYNTLHRLHARWWTIFFGLAKTLWHCSDNSVFSTFFCIKIPPKAQSLASVHKIYGRDGSQYDIKGHLVIRSFKVFKAFSADFDQSKVVFLSVQKWVPSNWKSCRAMTLQQVLKVYLDIFDHLDIYDHWPMRCPYPHWSLVKNLVIKGSNQTLGISSPTRGFFIIFVLWNNFTEFVHF